MQPTKNKDIIFKTFTIELLAIDVLFLRSDGATRCGPFCAVYNALEQITTDGEVDLFTIARQLKVRRPEFLSTLVCNT